MEIKKTAIDLENVTINYGNNKGIFNVDLKIKQGQVFGLIGPSGAGKTTLLRAILGFIEIQHGKIEVFEKPVWNNTQITNSKIGYISGEPIIPNGGTGLSFLKYYSKLRKIKNKKKMNLLIDRFNLDVNVAIKEMSKGMKQRLAIIAALMGDYDLYIFDEPTSGLDPIMKKRFVDIVLQLKKEQKTIVICSHMMDEIQDTCEQFIIIKNGKKVYENNVENLKQKGISIDEVFWDVYKEQKEVENNDSTL